MRVQTGRLRGDIHSEGHFQTQVRIRFRSWRKAKRRRTLEEFFTMDELSEYLRIKKSSLYAKVERREIPFYKIGSLLRFRRQEIEIWLESKRSQPADPRRTARDILRGTRRVKLDVDRIVARSIAEADGSRYNSERGKPGQIRSLGKEATDGNL